MEFEFDPEKSPSNELRHGVDFEWAQQLWRHSHCIIPAKASGTEDRSMILAKIEAKCYLAVFTKRGGAIRLISCHRADERLERIYEVWLKKSKES